MTSYDAWKLATPPEYEQERAEDSGEQEFTHCVECGAELDDRDGGGATCHRCAAYERHVDQQIDEAKEELDDA